MTATLLRTAPRRHCGGETALSVRIAKTLGWRRRRVEAALWGPLNLSETCARIITALKSAGADETLVRFIRPIDLAIHDAQPEAFRRELVLVEQEADGAEDLAETAFLTSQDLPHAKAYIRRCDETIVATTRLRNAVATKYGL